MSFRGLGAVVLVILVMAGCSVPVEIPSPLPTTTPIPADIQGFLDAAASGDLDGVRARLSVSNDAAGRYLTAAEISPGCAADEAAAVAAKVNDPNLTAYVYTGREPWEVRFESPDGANEGWGIELRDGGWYWQAQAASCMALWNSPSPGPN